MVGQEHIRATNLKEFWDAEAALEQIKKIYNASVQELRDAFAALGEHAHPLEQRLGASYPYLGITLRPEDLCKDPRLAFGAADNEGVYGTTITRPDLFADYIVEQINLLMENHNRPVYVGISDCAIPLPFAVDEATVPVGPEMIEQMRRGFVFPDLSRVDDNTANNRRERLTNPLPLSFFSAERIDFSLHRLYHYTGTNPEHFQHFILLTNYQRYVKEFVDYAKLQLETSDEYDALVEPGDVITKNRKLRQEHPQGTPLDHLPQMPAYHLKRRNGSGITLINIGVGPSNAKTITDHLAVLRPHCWLMLGHCAGLRRSQWLGDYVLAHAYVRDDHVLDHDLPAWVPIPALAEVQIALQEAVEAITGESGHDLKTRLRTGTVYTTDNRNWELRSQELYEEFNDSRAIALDMESATIAANGFRFRVPYGTLLCVSDKPIHGEIKLRGMANAFYRERVSQHLFIGIETMRILRDRGTLSLHSRKLRGIDDPPFR